MSILIMKNKETIDYLKSVWNLVFSRLHYIQKLITFCYNLENSQDNKDISLLSIPGK